MADQGVLERPAPARASRRLRARRAAVPYLLNAPSWIFLAVFFVIPLASVLALSVATGNPEVGYQYTGHVHEFVSAISTPHPGLPCGGVAPPRWLTLRKHPLALVQGGSPHVAR